MDAKSLFVIVTVFGYCFYNEDFVLFMRQFGTTKCMKRGKIDMNFRLFIAINCVTLRI